ncbi:hypothetical protein GCM10027059_42420 [Myceligenerans halotolerans]
MSRKIGRARFLHELNSYGVFPRDVKVGKSGTVEWVQEDFDYFLSLETQGLGRATWILWVGDQGFRQVRMRGFGAAKLTLRPVGDAAFVITDDVGDLEVFANEVRKAASFVADRSDFCRILMAEESVIRGEIEAWQMPSNYPSRLAEALMLSRIIASSELENEVRERIASAPDTNMFGKKVSAITSVRRWLKEYSRDFYIKVDV